MAMNLDADVGQIIKDFLNKKKSGKSTSGGKGKIPSIAMEQYKQAVIKCILVFSITGMISWGIIQLTESSVKKDSSEFTTLQDLNSAVAKIEQDIVSSTSLLAKNKKKVEEILPQFSDIEGSKTLFKLISNLSAQNSVTIRNLSLGETTEIPTPAKYIQNRILLEIEGYYPNYLKFKKELSKQKPILRIDSEVVKLNPNSGERKIDITLSFLDYSIEKGEYEKILQKK